MLYITQHHFLTTSSSLFSHQNSYIWSLVYYGTTGVWWFQLCDIFLLCDQHSVFFLLQHPERESHRIVHNFIKSETSYFFGHFDRLERDFDVHSFWYMCVCTEAL